MHAIALILFVFGDIKVTYVNPEITTGHDKQQAVRAARMLVDRYYAQLPQLRELLPSLRHRVLKLELTAIESYDEVVGVRRYFRWVGHWCAKGRVAEFDGVGGEYDFEMQFWAPGESARGDDFVLFWIDFYSCGVLSNHHQRLVCEEIQAARKMEKAKEAQREWLTALAVLAVLLGVPVLRSLRAPK